MPELCSWVENNCGEFVDCSGCEGTTPIYESTDEYVQPNHCGMKPPTRDEAIQNMISHSQIDWEEQYADAENPNLCQASCVYIDSYTHDRCDSTELIFICSTEDTPPNPACRPSQDPEEPSNAHIVGHEWCCPSMSNWE